MRVLFVCTGNTCRSPMAEALLSKMAREAGLDLEAKSAGVGALPGMPAAENAQAVLKERGITYEATSTSLDAELLTWADVVLVMTSRHQSAVLQAFPKHADKVFLLKSYVEDDERVARQQKQLDKLYAEAEMKRAQFMTEHQEKIEGWEQRDLLDRLRELTRQEEAQIRQLEAEMPDYDIADPVGGPIEEYRRCADELESLLRQWIRQLS